MARTYKDRNIQVEGKRRKQSDSRKLARVVIELAQAQEEAEVAAAEVGVRVRGRPASKSVKQVRRTNQPDEDRS